MTTVTDPGPAAGAGVGTAGGRPSPHAAARCVSPPPCARHTAPGSPDTGGVTISQSRISLLELSTNLREVSQCPEEAHTRALSMLKATTHTFTIKRFY